jgi:hypothetical protein
MKVLMLILAGGDGLYETLRSYCWATFMNSRPDEIEAYFYIGDPELATEHEFRGDKLYVKCSDNYWGVVKKLQMALAVFQHRFHEFDYICRPNLSSFLIFDRYLKALEDAPRKEFCYAVCNTHPIPFPSGCGFTITPDIAQEYIANAPPIGCEGGDDVSLGELLGTLKIPITVAPRIDITLERDWPTLQRLETEPGTFHVRIKHETNRAINDIIIWKRLLAKYVI